MKKYLRTIRLDDIQSIPNDSLLDSMYGKCSVFESCEKQCNGNILNTNLESTAISPLYTQATVTDNTNSPAHSHVGNDIPSIPSIEEWKEKILFKTAVS